MKRKSGKSDIIRQEKFKAALQGKKIPILTLDNKWYRLLDESTRAAVKGLEARLNGLLQRQGKLNTEAGDIRKLKRKLMDEIVPMVEEVTRTGDRAIDKKIDQNKRLVEECNERLESYKEELKELPRQIDDLNFQLMLLTMDSCYETMQENTEQIRLIEAWAKEIRMELKKQLARKQGMEQQNHAIYSYMHDVFGAEVVNVFDMQYNPEKELSVTPGNKHVRQGRTKEQDPDDDEESLD